jgi:DNA modification methylase
MDGMVAMIDEITTGDARELAKRIPDASVDLVFTDPVYERIEDYEWLAQEAARVLKPDCALLAFCAIGLLPETLAALGGKGLAYRWQGLWYQSNNDKQRGGFGFVVYSPFIWMEKGRSKVYGKTNDVANVPIPDGRHNHQWSKQPAVIARYMRALTKPGALVWEPFCGGGTIPAVCKMLGRHYIASEIDPATAERARERVFNTQPPLPGLIVEQLEVAL